MVITCGRCGTPVPGGPDGPGGPGGPDATPPPSWSCSLDDPRGTHWLCASCTRENLRAIEGKLDESWW